MIQKSIFFKHIIEEWRCSLVNEYYKKTLILLFYSASSLSSGPKVLQTRGDWRHAPLRKFFSFRCSEMPFPAFSAGHFQLISTKDAIVIYFTYPVLSAGSGAYQMEPPSPIQALGVNPFPSRFIIRTVSQGRLRAPTVGRANHND